MIDVGVALDAAPCLTLDIGATKIDGAMVAADGSISRRDRILVREVDDDLLAPIVSMLERVSEGASVSLLGVACAGPMTRDGNEVSPLNIAQWDAFPLRQRLIDATGLEVHIDGDARALALAEGVFGAARDDDSFLSMVVSTGIGGGLVLDGRLVDGHTGNAGHVGHTNVVPDGRACGCGGFGCLEAEASGGAIEAMSGRPPVDASESSRRRCAHLVGRAVGTLASVLDFDRCYIAGSVALGYGEEFFDVANEAARSMATMWYSKDLLLRPSGLGSDGPILGAALVGWRGAS